MTASPPTSSRPVRRRTVLAGAGAAGVLVAAGLSAAVATGPAQAAPVPAAAPAPTATAAARAAARPVAGNVSVSLWEWNWRSVARECTTVLGPAGYASVQVAPPQDSVKRTSLGNGSDTVLHPWWEVYQAVNYNLTSRMGTEAQFRSMVATCRKAGVKVIVDAVINHTTGQGNISYGGVSYSKYRYRGLYGPADFHSHPRDCPIAPPAGTGRRSGDITDFNDYRQVWNCELVGLEDLRTDTPKVRATLTAYLNKLLRYGVSGFRVDAAKHIPQADLTAIFSKLRNTVDGTRPYIALEVSPGSPGRISPWAYQRVGNLLGFDYAEQIKNAFESYNNPPNDGNIGDLKVFGTESGLLPGNRELVFIQNHDTERNGSTLNYKDPNNVIAHQFMLAWPHGTPQVYSAFTWTATDQSPPSDANGLITDARCGAAWTCVHRNTGVRNMVRFHNYVGTAPVRNWYDDGVNLVAFSRGARGFFSTNNTTEAKTVRVRTGLAPGRYCDIIHGSKTGSRTCSGPTVTVGAGGRATITVGGYDSVAFTAADRIR